jgi:ABC-2 type transport system permease protein
MYKVLDIAGKDLRRAFRSRFLLVFTFVIPVLVTLLFALMFGGVGGEEEGFALPQTKVRVVNLDEGTLSEMANVPADAAGVDLTGVDSLGDLLVRLLQGEAFADLLLVTEAADEAAARAAVDGGDSDVALIIPTTFTAALTQPDLVSGLELYRDPTLTVGPALVEALLTQIVEQMAARKLGAETTVTQLVSAGVVPDQALVAEVITAFNDGAAGIDPQLSLQVRAPAGLAGEEVDVLAQILGLIMGGMLVFFAFFTGAASMQTLITESEEGTLPRLLTTPTPPVGVLGGRMLATSLMLIVQVTVLLLFGRLAFAIGWGAPLPVLLAALGIVVAAAATGLFVVSLLRTSRQAGIVFGGLLTLTGMIGLLPVFTAGSGGNRTVEMASLAVPQGWAMRVLQLSMEGAAAAELLPVLGGVLLWSVVFTAVGYYRLQRRFA